MMINFFSTIQRLANWKGIRAGVIAAGLLTVLPPIFASQKVVSAPLTIWYKDAQNVTIDEVVDNPGSYAGRLVTLRSEAEKTDSPYSFRLDDNDGISLFGLDFDDDEVLVFDTSGVPFTLPEEDDIDVQVTGVVRTFILADIERELGVDLDPDLYVDYENKPVIFARSIALAPEPGEVTDDPKQFYGRAIAVEGEVDEIYSPVAFTLNDSDLFEGEDLLVINAVPEQVIEEDQNVVVVGELRPRLVVADIERDYVLGWDLELQRKLEVEYRQKPVLIVREVYPSAE